MGYTDPSNITYSSGSDDPVQMVNWYHAIAFCNKLSIKEGLTPVYSVTGVNFNILVFDNIPTSSNSTWDAATANWSANGYRLPTEMEWMWAAMGATSGSGYADPVYLTGYENLFAGSDGSNAIGDYAVFGYYGSETGRTTTERSNPAGSKLPNELGLYDMRGNVFEWNWDWYAATYPTGTIYSNTAAGRGAASGTLRVLRGGSWYSYAFYCAVAYRGGSGPYYQDYGVGFRVVCP
ncbi:MAG: SUMF1/EgtB/PvdO family nonheme iron enzyme [Spirochaetota bacterium]|nr:SUMF1/EgtB/PvdO family nonheme iron enzyme [Spirochaetota bacterium]